MKTETLLKSLRNVQYLRIFNLLREGPLCVCHILDILDEAPVKTLRQLQNLEKLGLVSAKRQGNWMVVYSLSTTVAPNLSDIWNYLTVNTDEHPYFAEDLNKRSTILRRFAENLEECLLWDYLTELYP